MRIILIVNESPVYIGCLNTNTGIIPRVGEHVKFDNKTFSVGKVLYDLDEGEVRIYLFNGI